MSPILKYPDPSRLYILFTDPSKYAWACVLTQEDSEITLGSDHLPLRKFLGREHLQFQDEELSRGHLHSRSTLNTLRV